MSDSSDDTGDEVDCENLPQRPYPFVEMEMKKGSEDFVFDREGKLVFVARYENESMFKLEKGGQKSLLLD